MIDTNLLKQGSIFDLPFEANFCPEKTKLLLPCMANSLRGNHICEKIQREAVANASVLPNYGNDHNRQSCDQTSTTDL